MGTTTFILTITLGEYEDKSTTVLAVSKDRGKLEAFREEHISKRTFRDKLNEEFQIELDKLKGLHPFTETYPVAPPKPVIPPRTKEEHAARIGIKGKYLSELEEYRKRESEYRTEMERVAKEMMLTKYELKGYDFNPRGFYYGYYSKPDENQYDIIEVREL